VSLRVQAIAEGRQSLFVTVNVKPGKMEEYESLIKSHSESTKPHRSIHLTPDAHLPETEVTNCYMNDRCMYFDFGINQDGSDPNSVYLYEVYEDEAALEEHRESAHLKEYLAAAENLTSGHDVRNINLGTVRLGELQLRRAVRDRRGGVGLACRTNARVIVKLCLLFANVILFSRSRVPSQTPPRTHRPPPPLPSYSFPQSSYSLRSYHIPPVVLLRHSIILFSSTTRTSLDTCIT
jgi:quinol monooxygenase YgiN